MKYAQGFVVMLAFLVIWIILEFQMAALVLFGIFSVMMCMGLALLFYKDKTTDSITRYTLSFIFGIIAPIYIGYLTYIDITNPCIEFEDTCEIECWGEGTPAYDCDCIYPCKKRKND